MNIWTIKFDNEGKREQFAKEIFPKLRALDPPATIKEDWINSLIKINVPPNLEREAMVIMKRYGYYKCGQTWNHEDAALDLWP